MTRAAVFSLLFLLATACSKKDEHAPESKPSASAMTGVRVFERYLAAVDIAEVASTLGASWSWHESIRDLRPIYMTLAGDVLLLDRKEGVWFLDTSWGTLERVAANGDAFKERMQNPSFAAPLLRIDMVDAIRSRGVSAGAGECFMQGLPPSVTGSISPGLVQPVSCTKFVAFYAQFAKATKDMPVGQEFRIHLDGVSDDEQPKRPFTKQPRDRRSFAL